MSVNHKMNTKVERNIKSIPSNSELTITAQNLNMVVTTKPQLEPQTNLAENVRSTSYSKDRDESSIPLIEHSNSKPPLARLEIEEFDDDDREVATAPYPGVDDGFFGNGEKPADPDVETINPDEIPEIYPRAGGGPDEAAPDEPDGRNVPPQNPPKYPPQPFPYPPGFGPDIEAGMIPDGVGSIPDINVYQNKKTLAQGMMDLALLSANANQLRYVLESYDRHPYFYPSLIMISLSLIFQVR